MDIKGYKSLNLQEIGHELLPMYNDESLDSDHHKLIMLYNESVIKAQRDEFNLEDLSFKLLSYGEHFKKEEELMKQYNYHQCNHHKDDHAIYMWKVQHILSHSIDHTESFLELLGFLHMWIMGHVFVVDRKFGEFLRTKRL